MNHYHNDHMSRIIKFQINISGPENFMPEIQDQVSTQLLFQNNCMQDL